MQGYIFETTNTKTGERYIGKRGAVSFDKNYLGDDTISSLALAIEKYGRPTFTVKMIMPYESMEELDAAFEAIEKPQKKATTKKKEVVVEEPKIEEAPVEEKAPKKRAKKTVEDK